MCIRDRVKEEGMAPWEIWISESQERMMLTVRPEHVDEVLYIFQKWDVPATVIGKATADRILRIYYKGYKVYEMDIDFVVRAVEYCRPYIRKKVEAIDETSPPLDYTKVLLEMLSHPNVASREWVVKAVRSRSQSLHSIKASAG